MAEEVPNCCEGCVNWHQFGKDCWVYWELKKSCTQHTPAGGEFNLQ